MIIAKDKRLEVREGADRLELFWRVAKSDRWLVSFPGFSMGAIFVGGSFTMPDRQTLIQMMLCGLFFIGLGAIAFWWFAVAWTKIVACPEGLTVTNYPFPKRRTVYIPGPFRQFYVKNKQRPGSLVTPMKLCAIDTTDTEDPLPCQFLSPTMAYQAWSQLQGFYRLEDEEVLGEVAEEASQANR